jgi:heme/copper-type cytochrome/quinol oxidase subunit 3
LILTILLAALFTGFQVYEYRNAGFNINDGIYGSTFYMLTGLHGAHVIIGTLFLTVALIRVMKHHFTTQTHIGFEAAA